MVLMILPNADNQELFLTSNLYFVSFAHLHSVTSFISISSGTFRTHSNISDGVFCEKIVIIIQGFEMKGFEMISHISNIG